MSIYVRRELYDQLVSPRGLRELGVGLVGLSLGIRSTEKSRLILTQLVVIVCI